MLQDASVQTSTLLSSCSCVMCEEITEEAQLPKNNRHARISTFQFHFLKTEQTYWPLICAAGVFIKSQFYKCTNFMYHTLSRTQHNLVTPTHISSSDLLTSQPGNKYFGTTRVWQLQHRKETNTLCSTLFWPHLPAEGSYSHPPSSSTTGPGGPGSPTWRG